ncbi:Pyridoxine 5'-phosphate synthase [Pseudovibrio axinellae]|uniref:Pyridoxine 5'-phosphate synthase n=1 Tax=Pseudovibrio axinellae TaxID=989403 RepID=A0A166AQI7_9HYPH|nr:pyridoxine 5'-phosphate synthase [Pseudovibrio axinellae]KZL21426.1 Pyridoxine 5'-phosphate synthase [Pseudovibrio axinellae]SEQ99886.1 pyridoxine 5'-phosphate synthase [Pseudovibrio axinellae]
MKTPSRLSVNVNAVAVLRNRRDLPWPSVTHLSALALNAGAKGITIHPRPDERHIRHSDVLDLSQMLKTEQQGKELCLEGYPDQRFMDLIEKVRPTQVLFVPDDPSQQTSDHGWDFAAHMDLLKEVIAKAKSWDIRTSLFVDPDPTQPALAAEAGAERIEIYTGPYGACYSDKEAEKHELEKVVATAQAAKAAGLLVNAGHDLTVENLPALIERVPYISEVSIGHGFTADALIYGFAESVRRFRKALAEI